ncbi:MAG: BatA domain-containing protein [Kiritimatiellaeota bacterium]|nr:BatA domain-containing protein [Kiritimatiellota bacterium]
MSFLSPWVLLGLAALAVPIVIHLMNRRAARSIDWGAFLFLRDSILKRKTRVLIEEMLLLGCRCLLVALLALAIARPFIQPESRVPWMVVLPALLLAVILFGVSFAVWRYPSWRWRLMTAGIVLGLLAAGAIFLEHSLNFSRFGRNAASDVIFILDGSSSMSLTQEERPNFESARLAMEGIIKTASRDTAFGLIIAGPVPRVLSPAPLSDRRELYRLLDEAAPTQGTMDVPAALVAATHVLAAGNNPVKHIILFADNQAVGWSLHSRERWKVVSLLFNQFPQPPHVFWRTFPLPAAIRNVALDAMTLSRDWVGTDRETVFTVTLRNTGTEPVTPESVSLSVEGETLSTHAVGQLESGDARTLSFRHRFTTNGLYTVTAAVVAEDDMPSDDTVSKVVTVAESLPVLIVEGNAVGAPLQRSAGYLSLALSPTADPAAATNFLMRPTTIEFTQLSTVTNFSDYAVVILSDLPRIPEPAATHLSAYVANGGGLWIIPGLRSQSISYNTWMHDGELVMPLQLSGLQRFPRDEERPSIDTRSFSHDALRNVKAASDLSYAHPEQYWAFAEAAHPERVAARFSNGDAFLAFRKVGRGLVLLSALPFDATLSTLPSRTGFLPLIHDLVSALAHAGAVNLNAFPSEGSDFFLGFYPKTNGTTTVHATAPDGETFDATLLSGDSGLHLRLDRTLVPGHYDIALPPEAPASLFALTGGATNLPLYVIPGVTESDMTPIAPAQLDSLRDYVSIQAATEDDHIRKALLGESFGKEIWRTLATIALLLFFLEIALTRWIAIQRKTGEQEPIAF